MICYPQTNKPCSPCPVLLERIDLLFGVGRRRLDLWQKSNTAGFIKVEGRFALFAIFYFSCRFVVSDFRKRSWSYYKSRGVDFCPIQLFLTQNASLLFWGEFLFSGFAKRATQRQKRQELNLCSSERHFTTWANFCRKLAKFFPQNCPFLDFCGLFFARHTQQNLLFAGLYKSKIRRLAAKSGFV